MDKDLQKAISTGFLIAMVAMATVAWIAFAERPTKGNFKSAVRRTFPLL